MNRDMHQGSYKGSESLDGRCPPVVFLRYVIGQTRILSVVAILSQIGDPRHHLILEVYNHFRSVDHR